MLSAQSSQNNVHATLSPFSWPGVRHTPPCSFSCSVFLLGLLGLILGDLLLLQALQELQVVGVLLAFVNGGHGPLVHLLLMDLIELVLVVVEDMRHLRCEPRM